MKEKVIKEIEQKMASILNNEQKEKLREVLIYTFFNITSPERIKAKPSFKFTFPSRIDLTSLPFRAIPQIKVSTTSYLKFTSLFVATTFIFISFHYVNISTSQFLFRN